MLSRRQHEQILVKALQRVAELQPEALAIIERHGFIFDSIGAEPGNWQHLAFSLYTDLCEAELVARSALDEIDAVAMFSDPSLL